MDDNVLYRRSYTTTIGISIFIEFCLLLVLAYLFSKSFLVVFLWLFSAVVFFILGFSLGALVKSLYPKEITLSWERKGMVVK